MPHQRPIHSPQRLSFNMADSLTCATKFNPQTQSVRSNWMISLFEIHSINLSSFLCFAFNRSSSLALGGSFLNNSISSSFFIDLLCEGDFSLVFFGELIAQALPFIDSSLEIASGREARKIIKTYRIS